MIVDCIAEHVICIPRSLYNLVGTEGPVKGSSAVATDVAKAGFKIDQVFGDLPILLTKLDGQLCRKGWCSDYEAVERPFEKRIDLSVTPTQPLNGPVQVSQQYAITYVNAAARASALHRLSLRVGSELVPFDKIKLKTLKGGDR